MNAPPMHPDEVVTDAALVARLVATQMPHWAGMPVDPVTSSGTDNALYRLGDELVVRMPRIPGAIGQIAKEAEWLPVLATHLPLAIPVPLAVGAPGEGYPWSWSVGRWIVGADAITRPPEDRTRAADDLGAFVTVLRSIDATGGPVPGESNFGRGVALARRDDGTRSAIAELGARVDADGAARAWQDALDAPPWSGPGVWIHGDLQPGNLLLRDDRLTAVIDFGGLGVGDPAYDVMPGWTLFAGESRERFRLASGVDDATWLRGRGLALSVALVALPYYWSSNPTIKAASIETIAQVLAEYS